MKNIFTLFAILLWSSIAFGQQKEAAENLVNEGVAFHDKGDYESALATYDKALALDKDNLLALAEKALTLSAQNKLEEAITCCQLAIAKHPDDEDLKYVYSTCADAYDGLKQIDKALAVYEEGIKKFPDFYQIHFNKGIALAGVKRYDEAILSFQKSVTLNPKHPGSHNALARLLSEKKRIPSLMAYCRFFVLEPESQRAKENLAGMQNLLKGNIEKTGKNSITINIDSEMLADTVKNGKVTENSFSTIDMILSMDAALDYDKKNKKKTEVQLFQRKFETVCAYMEEMQKDNFGFYWEYYAPYFIEMKERNLTETFSYIAFATSEDPSVKKWLKGHPKELEAFYTWSKNYSWK
ncbi:MAG: hypothetical protein K0R51_600 [Cytophagaceae bacterium]|jgi:tetratricopeptide (TPR) repeat protein|nr:hypothetical protein [Cytophagaceae bacterium]